MDWITVSFVPRQQGWYAYTVKWTTARGAPGRRTTSRIPSQLVSGLGDMSAEEAYRHLMSTLSGVASSSPPPPAASAAPESPDGDYRGDCC